LNNHGYEQEIFREVSRNTNYGYISRVPHPDSLSHSQTMYLTPLPGDSFWVLCWLFDYLAFSWL